MKNKTRKCLLTIALAIAMIAVFMPAAALAEDGTESVTDHDDFVAAIANSEVTTINVTAGFALTEDVTIGREVIITCLSDPGYTINTGDYSVIITGSEAVVTISGNLTITGQKPIQVTDLGTATISGGAITAAGEDGIGVYVEDGTANISGGTIEATGDGSSGVYVSSDGTANISGGTITATGAYSAGVWVEVGTATVSGGTITAAGDDSAGVLVVRLEGAADISGGIITAAGAASAGVYVVCGTVTISDDPEISGDEYGVYVDSGTVEISGGTITAISAYSCGVYANGVDSTVTVSGGTITALEEYGSGIYVEDGTANISGGTITATGVNGIGVYVFGGETNISGGTITATGDYGAGVSVGNSGALTISDDPEISGDSYGVDVSDSTADISGGTITAFEYYSIGVYVRGVDSTVTVSGGTITVAEGSSGVFVDTGTANISGGTITTGSNCNGVALEDGTANISGDAEISGEYGVRVCEGENIINVSVSAGLTISGVYNYDGKAFLTDLPVPVTMAAGETKMVELGGVDENIDFVVERDTDSELVASIAGSIVTLAPPGTTPADTYNLVLYASSEINYFNLTIPVTVAAETTAPILSAPGASDITHTAAKMNFTSGEAGTYYYLVYSAADAAPDKAAVKAQGTAVVKGTGAALAATNTVSVSDLTPSTAYKAYVVVEDAAGNISDVATMNITTTAAPDTMINIAAIAGVAAPVRGSAPVTAITATDQYTGTVSWSPAVADNKFAADTVYTAKITLTAKAGYTLTGVAANFFTVAGATTVSNAAGSGVVIAVFPATASESGGGNSGGSGGGNNGSSPSNAHPPVNTNPSKVVITSGTIEKETGTTPDGKTVETFTVQNTAASQIEQAKGEGKASVEFNIASSQATVTEITIPSTVLESASGMNIFISTPYATLELPAALVNALAAAGQNLNLTVTRGEDMANPESGTVLGTTTEITTNIVGDTQVTIPLAGVSIPADPAERAAFLNSLAVFTYHSDGETELITGEIIYDASGNPVSISFPVDKFSTFAIVKLSQRTIALNIGSPAARLNGLNVALDAPAFINPQSNRTLVPLRFIGEALGAKVEWLSVARQVRITDGEQEILLTIDSQLALKNGQSTRIDCAPVVVTPGRTFLPLRFISETLGAEVIYDEATKEIIITREYGK